LRILQRGQLVKKLGSGRNLRASVLVAESGASNGSTKKLEVTVGEDSGLSSFGVDQELLGKKGGQVSVRRRPWEDEFALLHIEFETQSLTVRLQVFEGGAHGLGITGQDAVVQVEQVQVQRGLLDLREFFDQFMDGQGEEERTQRVSLLNASGRVDRVRAKLEVGGGTVTPVGPFGKAREDMAAPLQKLRAVHIVEGVFEIKFEQTFVSAVGMSFGPGPASVDSSIKAERASDTELSRGEIGGSVIFSTGAQGFTSEPAQDFSNCDGPYASFRLGKGDKASSGQDRSDRVRGLPAGKQVNNLKQLVQGMVLSGWSESIKEVLDPEARRAGG
jgi:hypothetical protein